MSGATIPYHLRQNKAINRNLFLELLARVGRWKNISDYAYVGFGGPYLEDFKQIHGGLRLSDMTSLDTSENTTKRQAFNAPVSGIKIRNQSSGEFLMKHEFVTPSVVWFDYTAPSEIGTQLSETELLVRKLRAGDIAKITVNCSPETLGRPAKEEEDLREFRLARAKQRLAEYFPPGADEDWLTAKKYPELLLSAVAHAAKKGMDTKVDCLLEPLSCYAYADGQQMLSVAMAIVRREDHDQFLSATRLGHWPYKASNWQDLRWISVPQLSAKERLFVESMLPGTTDPKVIWDRLGYFVGDTADDADALMTNFLQYYRQYPWYSRVQL
jgi:hypothetical protein